VRFGLFAAAVAVAGLAATAAAPVTAGAAASPIKIALITSETGIAASEFATSPQGFLARVDLQNAEGGVNGHMIDPIVINDQGSLTTVVIAVQQAISDGVVGIVNDTPFFYAAYKYAQQAGIPVTGGSFDGPEWGEQPNTNMFASDTGSIDPKYPVNTGLAKFLKAKGGTVLGSYGYGISPSSLRAAIGLADAAKTMGMKVGVLNTTVPFGSVAFTTEALTAKSAGVNTLYGTMDNNSNFALLTAFEQAGVKLKVVSFPTGYESDIIHTPVWQAVQGVYFTAEFRPFSLPDAGTQQMAAALKKYEHRSASDFPTYNIYESWLGADLMIKGLQLAGKNPTSAAVIKDLRNVKAYNGNGLLPGTINFSTIFGHNTPESCAWYMKAEKSGYAATSANPVCGTYIPGSTTVSSS
jgi:branched-chain amino acid transport system substrate-binding protein